MIFTKFHENQLIIDGEINKKHALLVSCGLRQQIMLAKFYDNRMTDRLIIVLAISKKHATQFRRQNESEFYLNLSF